MTTLNLFPARVAIGAVQNDGSVLMTPEFFRALSDLLQRVGGPNGSNADEVEALFSIETGDVGVKVASDKADDAMLTAMFVDEPSKLGLMARIEALEAQIAQITDANAVASQAIAYAQYTEIQYAFGAPPVDWEHPGKIGNGTANTGKFTSFGCNGKNPQTAFALGAAATDLPTVIALANNLRTMSINNGIGS